VRSFPNIEIVVDQLLSQFGNRIRVATRELYGENILFRGLFILFQDDILEHLVQIQNPGDIFEIHIHRDKPSHECILL
jgi:hypothetical protein